MKKILFIASFMLIAIFACSSVYAADMTAAELLATVSDKTITLTEDVTLTTNLVVPSDVEVIDLGGKTLTLKGCLSYNEANPIVVNSTLEIKNGTITRYVAQNTSEKSLIRGSLIVVSGSDANLTLNGVTLDGKNLGVTSRTDAGAHALYIVKGASATVNNSKLINNKVGPENPSVHSSTIHANEAKNVILNGVEVSNNSNEDVDRGGIVWVKKAEKFEINNSVISNNTVVGTGIVAVNACGTFTFSADSVIKNNKAGEAAGIHIQDSNAIISGTISGNEATKTDGNGGGLYTLLSDATKIVTITDTAVIKDNIAGGAGGGVYVNGPATNTTTGNVVMQGGLITGNTAKGTPNATTLKDGGGAGVYVARGSMIINGGTIEGNKSTSGIGDGILVSHAGGNTEAGKLEVLGGYIDGTVKVSDTYADVTVEGGAFTDDVSAYIAADFASKEVDGVNYVGKELTVTVKAGLNGKASAAEKAVVGQPVKVTVTPDKNYELASIKVTDEGGKEVTVKDNTFTMPETDVTVEVTFKEMAKDGTPATGSMNVVMLVSAAIAVTTFGVLVSKKYAKNN